MYSNPDDYTYMVDGQSFETEAAARAHAAKRGLVILEFFIDVPGVFVAEYEYALDGLDY